MKRSKKASRTWIENRRIRKHIFKSNEYTVLKDKETGLKSLVLSDKRIRDQKVVLAPANIRRDHLYNPLQHNYQMMPLLPPTEPNPSETESMLEDTTKTEVSEKVEGISGI